MSDIDKIKLPESYGSPVSPEDLRFLHRFGPKHYLYALLKRAPDLAIVRNVLEHDLRLLKIKLPKPESLRNNSWNLDLNDPNTPTLEGRISKGPASVFIDIIFKSTDQGPLWSVYYKRQGTHLLERGEHPDHYVRLDDSYVAEVILAVETLVMQEIERA